MQDPKTDTILQGTLEDMADLSTLDPETQDRKVKDYKLVH